MISISPKVAAAIVLLGAAGSLRAQSLQFFEFEPNETCAAGTPFTSSSGLGGGQLASETDVDYFRFEPNSFGRLDITLSPQNNTYDGGVVRFQIFAPNGALLAGRELSSDEPPIPLRALFGPGVYCLRVDEGPRYRIFTKEYRILPQVTSSAAAMNGLELEPNDVPGLPAQLSSGGSAVLSQLSSVDDLDYLGVDLPFGSDATIAVDVESRNYDGTSLQATIVNDAGDVLAGREIDSDQPSARTLYARRPGGGRIYVKLLRNRYSMMDRYVLVTATSSPISGLRETEPNNLPGSDAVIGPGELRGQLSSQDDVDYFDVQLLAGVAQFQLRPENSSYDGGVVGIELQRLDGVVLASRSINSDSAPQIMNVGIPADGVYRLVAKETQYQIFDKHYLIGVPAGLVIFSSGFE